jgi:GH25 family lysozyme M1 (1,4-beta-N-acetylmuramidase)
LRLAVGYSRSEMSRTRRVANAFAAAALVVAVLTATPTAASAVPAGMLAGIDVYHWQGTIDWPTVASTNVRFVIARATQGTAVDPTYPQNLAGATENGIAVGTYHVAVPSAATGDASAEPDAFVAAARNASGDILPVLDLEDTGDLSVADLQDWVRRWLSAVRSALGVRPMIYTSPSFWHDSMGDTEWFANHGFPLWIAHWDVKVPTVPANDWGGHGWTFWQWNDCWTVSGITGCVDGDRFLGTDLTTGEISQLNVTPAAGGIVNGTRIACGDGSDRCSRLANPGDLLTLTATPDEGAVFMGWTGACASAGTSPTCTVAALGAVDTSGVFGYPVAASVSGTGAGTVVSSPVGVSCGSTCSALFEAGTEVTFTATPDSASSFGVWGGVCGGVDPTCVLTVTSPIDVAARFDALVQQEEDGAGTRFVWGIQTDPRAIGGSYLLDHRAGASETFAFRGDAVTLYTISGPQMGKARLGIDDTTVGTFNGYAASFTSGVAHEFTGLVAGDHTITITALGTRSSAATGTRVGVDALRASGTLHRTPRPAAGAWSPVAAASAGGGGYVVNDVAGATATLRFTGTGATLITVRGPSMGRAEIWIDGAFVRTVDLYSSTFLFGVERTVSGLSDGPHVMRIAVLGTRRAASTGAGVAVDGWIIK